MQAQFLVIGMKVKVVSKAVYDVLQDQIGVVCEIMSTSTTLSDCRVRFDKRIGGRDIWAFHSTHIEPLDADDLKKIEEQKAREDWADKYM